MKKMHYLITFCVLLLTIGVNAQDIALYRLSPIEKSNMGFVSLSDNYPLSTHPDSLAIPDIKAKGPKSAKYFKLDQTYRKRFLSKTKTAETDQVFIYDYATNALAAFAVKDLNVVAMLNVYSDESDWPYAQEDYMFGFEIKLNGLKGFGAYFNTVLVALCKKNPFEAHALKPVVWKKIKASDFPQKAVKKDVALQAGKYTPGASYRFEGEGFQYFVRDYVRDNHTFARRLVVLQPKTQKIIYEKVYSESEGVSLAPLNDVDNSKDTSISQWIGKLFKNKAAVIFGFEYQSFGCPIITILGQPAEEIYINCDNRH